MEFRKYQHIERFGTAEVNSINEGRCYIFPKIDGTNASCWLENGEVKCGSRKRALTLDNDNANFYNTIINDERIKNYLIAHPDHRLYGEWLVPHTVKTYTNDAWNKFYIFDVVNEPDVMHGSPHMSYDEYAPLLDEYGLDYLKPIEIIDNPTRDDFARCLEKNTVLIKNDSGVGEGIVIKNYAFFNKYGRQTWAKIISAEFNESKHRKAMKPTAREEAVVEKAIVDKYVTIAFVEKEFAKLVLDNEWTSKMIPRLLNTVYHEFIIEESWNFIKEFKNPTINFRTLQTLVFDKVKEVKSELF